MMSSGEEVTRPTDESAERTSEPRIVDLRFELPTYRADLLITAEEKVSANIKALRNRAVIAIAVSVVAGVVGFLVNFTIGFHESWSFFVSAGAVAIGALGASIGFLLVLLRDRQERTYLRTLEAQLRANLLDPSRTPEGSPDIGTDQEPRDI